MPLLTINHKTVYRYTRPVAFGEHRIMLRPRDGHDLRVLSGDLEIELLEWVSGNTPHRDFIQSGREGMHHIRFRVDDADAWVAKLKACGYEPIWSDRTATPDLAFAYCERPGDPLIVEVFEYNNP